MSKFVFKADVFVRESHYFDCRACGGNGTAIISLGSKYPTMAALCERCVEQLHDDLGKHIESLKPKPPEEPEDPLVTYSNEFMKPHSYISTMAKRSCPAPVVEQGVGFYVASEEYGFQCPCVMTKIPECKACSGKKVIWFEWSSVHKKNVALLNIVNRFRTANGIGESFTALKVS